MNKNLPISMKMSKFEFFPAKPIIRDPKKWIFTLGYFSLKVFKSIQFISAYWCSSFKASLSQIWWIMFMWQFWINCRILSLNGMIFIWRTSTSTGPFRTYSSIYTHFNSYRPFIIVILCNNNFFYYKIYNLA